MKKKFPFKKFPFKKKDKKNWILKQIVEKGITFPKTSTCRRAYIESYTSAYSE